MTEMARGVRPWICPRKQCGESQSGIPAVISGLGPDVILPWPSLTTPKILFLRPSQHVSNLLSRCLRTPTLVISEKSSTQSIHDVETAPDTQPQQWPSLPIPAIVPISVKIQAPSH